MISSGGREEAQGCWGAGVGLSKRQVGKGMKGTAVCRLMGRQQGALTALGLEHHCPPHTQGPVNRPWGTSLDIGKENVPWVWQPRRFQELLHLSPCPHEVPVVGHSGCHLSEPTE